MTHTAPRPTRPAVRRLLPARARQLQAPAAPLAAECIPVGVPDVISRPGSYCVIADFEGPLSPGASAIEIQADHVVLDFQGHVVRNTAAPQPNGAIGVRAWDRSHIVVRNGTLFRLLQGVDSMVIGNRLVATWNGVWMNATGSVYRDNLVGQVPGGGTHFSGGIDAGGNVAY
jgi:hypothetical protein